MGLSKKDFQMVAVLLCGAVLVVLNQTLLSPALPTIMTALNVDATTVQWLSSGYSLTEAVVIPLSAYFMGKLSTRKIFMGGMGLFCIGSIVAAIAPVFPVLLLGRVLQAMSTGIVMPSVISVVLLIFPRERRGTAMGIVSLVISFAPAIGPSLSGILIDSVGWRFLFVIVAVLTAAIIAGAFLRMSNKEGFESIEFDKLSVVLSCIGLVSLLYGFSSFSSSSNIALPIGLMLIGVIFIGLFAYRQMKLESPLLKVDILTARRYRTAALIVFVLQMAMASAAVIIPLYIQNTLGHSATVSGLTMLPGAIIGAACGLVSGRLYDQFGVRGVAIGGSATLAAAGFGLVFLGADTSVLLVALAYTVLIVGIQFLMTPLNTWGLNSLDNSVIQHANALMNTLNQIGASVGTALIVSLTAMPATFYPNASADEYLYLGQHIAFIALCALMCLTFVCVLVFVRARKTDHSKAEAARIAAAHGYKPRAIAMAHEGTKVDLSESDWNVGDVMNKHSLYLYHTSTVRDAVSLLAKSDTSGFPILGEEMQVIGFISDGDIMKYLAVDDSRASDGFMLYQVFDSTTLQSRLDELLKYSVMDIATTDVICVEADMKLEDACKMLSGKRIKKMPVVHEGKYAGCISRRNVIAAMSYYLTGTTPVMTDEGMHHWKDMGLDEKPETAEIK